MTKKEYKKWIKRLVKYWKMRATVLKKFKAEEYKIEKLIKKETGMNLEFFYTIEGECCGIGHEELERRDRKRLDYFPLIHDMDLMKEIEKESKVKYFAVKPAKDVIKNGKSKK